MTPTSDLVALPNHKVGEGRALVLRLYAVIKLLRGHGPHNAAFTAGLDQLVQSINGLLPHGGHQLQLVFYDDILMLNGAILRVSAQVARQFSTLSHLLLERGVGGIGFTQPMHATVLKQWLLCYDQPVAGPEDTQRIQRTLEALSPHGVQTMAPKVLMRQDVQAVKISSLSFALQAYARAILGFGEFVEALKIGQDPFSGKLNLVRIVQDLVDLSTSSPGLLRKVMRIRDEHRASFETAAGGYAARHAASTCVWSVLMGAVLELNRYELLDLGTSTLLSKVGFALLPEEMTEKQGALTAHEKRELRLGTLRAVQALIARSRLSDIMMRRVIVAYEHQRPFAHPNHEPTNTHLYSRIVGVADAFDAMVSERPWRPAMEEPVALQNMQQQAGTRFDPTLVQVLETIVRA